MLVNLPDDVAEEIANEIGSNDPQEIAEAAALLWSELGNPVEMIEDVKPEVPVR